MGHKHNHVHVHNVSQKFVEVPEIQIVDSHVHIPIQKHRHVPMIQKVQKTVEVPEIQTIEKIVEIPYIQTVEKTVEVPQAGETVNGGQRSVTMTLETVRQEAPAEFVQVTEMGPPLPA